MNVTIKTVLYLTILMDGTEDKICDESTFENKSWVMEAVLRPTDEDEPALAVEPVVKPIEQSVSKPFVVVVTTYTPPLVTKRLRRLDTYLDQFTLSPSDSSLQIEDCACTVSVSQESLPWNCTVQHRSNSIEEMICSTEDTFAANDFCKAIGFFNGICITNYNGFTRVDGSPEGRDCKLLMCVARNEGSKITYLDEKKAANVEHTCTCDGKPTGAAFLDSASENPGVWQANYSSQIQEIMRKGDDDFKKFAQRQATLKNNRFDNLG